MKNKSTAQLIAITLMIIGIGLTYWGYNISGGLESQFSQALTGSSSDNVMFRYITGVTSFAVGLFMFFKK